MPGKTGLPGLCRITVWNGRYAEIENHSGILEMQPESVKVLDGKRIVSVQGENLLLQELNGTSVKIKGKISSIDYLT